MVEVIGIGRTGDGEAVGSGDLHHDVVQIILGAGVLEGKIEVDDLSGRNLCGTVVILADNDMRDQRVEVHILIIFLRIVLIHILYL